MNEQKLQELKSLYESKLGDSIKNNYVPFFVRMTDCYDGKNGVLFVGKAENMDSKDNTTIEDAFRNAHKWINPDKAIQKPTGKAVRSAYNRVVYQITKFLNKEKNINHFARTNLYKLSTTKSYAFGSEFETAYIDVFKKEIELLQPKYVIFLTSGLEKDFLKMGKNQVVNETDFLSKKIKSIEIEGFNSVFISAFHPQGKPEKELTEKIISLIK